MSTWCDDGSSELAIAELNAQSRESRDIRRRVQFFRMTADFPWIRAETCHTISSRPAFSQNPLGFACVEHEYGFNVSFANRRHCDRDFITCSKSSIFIVFVGLYTRSHKRPAPDTFKRGSLTPWISMYVNLKSPTHWFWFKSACSISTTSSTSVFHICCWTEVRAAPATAGQRADRVTSRNAASLGRRQMCLHAVRTLDVCRFYRITESASLVKPRSRARVWFDARRILDQTNGAASFDTRSMCFELGEKWRKSLWCTGGSVSRSFTRITSIRGFLVPQLTKRHGDS